MYAGTFEVIERLIGRKNSNKNLLMALMRDHTQEKCLFIINSNVLVKNYSGGTHRLLCGLYV